MPRLVDPNIRGELVLEVACRLVVRGGLRALSVRGIAAELEISPSSVLHQFTDRARLVRVLTLNVGHERLRRIGYRSHRDGVLAFVPDTEEDIALARVWLALCELARTDEELAVSVASVRARSAYAALGLTSTA